MNRAKISKLDLIEYGEYFSVLSIYHQLANRASIVR